MAGASFQEWVLVKGKGWGACFSLPCHSSNYEYFPNIGETITIRGKKYSIKHLEMLGYFASVVVNEEIL